METHFKTQKTGIDYLFRYNFLCLHYIVCMILHLNWSNLNGVDSRKGIEE